MTPRSGSPLAEALAVTGVVRVHERRSGAQLSLRVRTVERHLLDAHAGLRVRGRAAATAARSAASQAPAPTA